MTTPKKRKASSSFAVSPGGAITELLPSELPLAEPVHVADVIPVPELPEWLVEYDVLALLLAGGSLAVQTELIGDQRAALRTLARRGRLRHRRHPEHGWWEYSTAAVMAPTFPILFDAVVAELLAAGV